MYETDCIDRRSRTHGVDARARSRAPRHRISSDRCRGSALCGFARQGYSAAHARDLRRSRRHRRDPGRRYALPQVSDPPRPLLAAGGLARLHPSSRPSACPIRTFGWCRNRVRKRSCVNACARWAGEVEFGKALATFTQNQHGVDAILTNGERLRADFLVGCDGGHSTVRKILGLRLQGEAIEDKPMLVADLEVAGLDRRDWHVWPFAIGGAIGLCPLPNTPLFQLIASKDQAARHREHCAQSHRPSRRARCLEFDLPAGSAHGRSLPRRTCILGRRRGARASASRRPRTQHRRAGRVQLGLEARICRARRTRFAARHLRD